MQELSPDSAKYQYPDPDDLDDGARFSWTGDDNDYIPEALRQRTSVDWLDPGAEYTHSDCSPLDQFSHQEDGESGERGTRSSAETNRRRESLNDSDEEVMTDDLIEDYPITGLNTPPAAGKSPNNRQRQNHHTPGSKGGESQRRGLRNAAKPSPEFNVLHANATTAYIGHDYDEAESLILQALQINPEIYAAHGLLSQIHAARGDLDKAIAAAYSGAHTQPRNVDIWSRIARMVLERDPLHTTATLRDAVYCYNRIIAVDTSNVEARFQRAALNHELGKFRYVVTEYEVLSKSLPHDTTVLRHLAQASIEINEPDRALKLYSESIDYFKDLEPLTPTSFTWSDVNVLVELYLFCREYDTGLEALKSLSRWLLGRLHEFCWDDYTEDDREWDLENHPRRTELSGFEPDAYEVESYGAGLPLDLRIKLGILRLNSSNQNVEEAIGHFEWLEPTDNEIGAKIFDYPDLFRDVARALLEKNLYEEAIRFYEPLKHIIDDADDSYTSELARCYTLLGRIAEAEALQSSIQELNEDDGDNDYSESDSIEVETEARKGFIADPTPKAKRPRKRIEKEKENLDFLYELFKERRILKISSLEGHKHLEAKWMNITQRLVQRFMQERAFFQDARNPQSTETSQEARHTAEKNIEPQPYPQPNLAVTPGDLAGITTDEWLDIFLEYGISLATKGNASEAYRIMTAATQANVFNETPDSVFLIHVCWITCALLNNDDETLCSVSRWFMRDFQFVGDAYRLFAALNRLCDSEIIWYNCGPSQKHILRQVKAMDFSLAGDARISANRQERSACTAKDSQGNIILPENMDVSLLMLYGHVLYAGKSYAYANNYFLRALSVDPDNSIIKLSLALGYMHHALKRQADNRHQLIMQGLAFLFEYYNRRREEGGFSEQQEAAYNVGRAFHLLGLTHIAVPYYEHCLELSDSVHNENDNTMNEDFAQEAALALQGIWATNGNQEKALELTERWLQM